MLYLLCNDILRHDYHEGLAHDLHKLIFPLMNAHFFSKITTTTTTTKRKHLHALKIKRGETN